MFKELDLVTLIAPIPIDRTSDIPFDSPLLKNGNPGEGLLPGDVGTIVCVLGNDEAFYMEFLEPDSYTVAIAMVFPSQMRPATQEELDNDRFWRKEPFRKIG